jgi:hypothetical protein
MLKKFNNSFAGIFLIIVGIVIALQIPSIKVMKVAMDSKLLPKVCVVLLVFFGIILIIQDLVEFWQTNQQRKNAANTSDLPTAKKSAESLSATEKIVTYGGDRPESGVPVISIWLKEWIGIIRVALCVMSLAIFVLMLRPFGFIISGIFYLLLTFYLLTPKEKWKSIWFYVVALIMPVLVYFLFVHTFNVLLPFGDIW